jgi:hypothetical protein
MKNNIYLIILAILPEIAIGQAFKKGDFIISAGYGSPTVGRSAVMNLSNSNYEVNQIGYNPIFAKAEYALSDEWGLAICYFNSLNGFRQTYESFEGFDANGAGIYETQTDEYRSQVQAISLRANYHFPPSEEFDLYFGFGGGPKFGSFGWSSTDPDFLETDNEPLFPFAIEITFGGRYFFTKNFAAYGEVGFARAFGQLGLSYRI